MSASRREGGREGDEEEEEWVVKEKDEKEG